MTLFLNWGTSLAYQWSWQQYVNDDHTSPVNINPGIKRRICIMFYPVCELKMWNILGEKKSKNTRKIDLTKILSRAEISTVYMVLANPSVWLNLNSFCSSFSSEFFIVKWHWGGSPNLNYIPNRPIPRDC